MDTVRFFAANTQPNPVEVDYWVDLYDNPYGGSIKYYNGTEWVRLAASGGIPDFNKYYTKVQVNQLLNDKASVQSVESKVDDEEVKDVIKNITFRTSNPNEVQMVLAKYDTTTVAISLPKASNVSAGIVTSDDFKDFVKQVDFQQLYQELYDSNSSIMNAINDIKAKYQKKLTAGSNIKISDDNVISATISIEGGDIDIDGINNKIDTLTSKLQEEVTRSTDADNKLTRDLSAESTTARAAEKKNADNIASNTQAIQKEVTDRNAAIKVETDRATAAENKLANDIVTTVETEKDRAEGVEQVIINDLAEEVTRAKVAEQANKTAINKEVTDRQSAIATEVDNRNAAIEVEKQRALKAEAALDSKIATHTNEINTALATKADKSTTYNKIEVDSKVSTINQTKQDKLTAGSGIKIENNTVSSTLDVQLYKIVDSLPSQDVEPGKIYLVLSETSTESNKYTEYVYVNGEWEIIGSYTANVDLSGYLTKTDAASTYQPKGNYALKTEIPDVSTKADTSYVNTQIQTVNTEINKKANKADLHAVATSGNYNDLTNKLKAGSGVTITSDNTINTSVDLSGVTNSISELDSKIEAEISRATIAESNKVDKIVGKGLSTNDYTTNEKNKLAGIASGAEVNVQSDWNQTDINSDDYIKNKPVAATIEKDGLMSASDKSKLNKINDVNFAFNGVDYKVDSISLKGQALNINQGTFLNKTQEISQASTTQAGVMSSADKKKFDSVPNTVLSSISFRTGNANNLSIGAQTSTYDTATGVYKSSERVIGMPVVSGTQAGIMIASDKTKLDGIAEGANAYTLPAATAQTLGGVKIGSNISLADGGVISINKTNVTTALGYTPLESVDTSNFVTLSGTQTIAGKKTFSDIIYFNQQIQGNALSASKLQTARQINGTDFNGSANITTSKWGTSRNLTIGKTTKAVDGSNEVSWLTSEIADNATTTTDGWMSKEDKLALANLNSDFYGKEQVTVSVKKDGVAHSVQIDIKNKDNDEVIATSTGSSLTTRIVYGVKYYVSVPDIDKYTISAESLEYTASQQMRTINLEYIRYDEITIDQTVTDPNSMISGDVNGTVLQWIRNNTHRYVAKKTGDGQVTICQLSDNDTTKFYDNLTSSSAYIRSINHGVFVRIPRFWYKATETSTNIWKIGFSNRQQDSTWKEWDGNDLIGAYEGVVNGSQLLSISGEPSTGSVSQTDFKSYARTNGTGYTLVKWKHHCIVGVLYYALYGNTNCQVTIGSGTNSYTKNTGLTNSLGMNDSSASATGNSGSINFLGLENWWGNKYEFIDNVTFNHGSIDYKFYIIEDDGSSREVQAHPYTGTFYPTVMIFGEHLDLVMKPNTTSGTTSTGFCDSQYFSGSSNQVVRRSCSSSYAYGGVAYLDAYYSASSTGSSIGSRLAFRGTIIEEKDIETFKALK